MEAEKTLLELDKKAPIFAGIIGESMLPMLRPDCKVLAFPMSFQTFRPGDLVLFTDTESGLVCHRLVFKMYLFNKCILLHIGDASYRIARIKKNNIIGKVIAAFDDSSNEIKVTQKRICIPKSFCFFLIWVLDSFLLVLKKYFHLHSGIRIIHRFTKNCSRLLLKNS